MEHKALAINTARFEIENFPMGDPRGGIAHVLRPEKARSQPGMAMVCGDSHTSTHGAFGALAFGVSTSEVEQVLATQTIRQRRSRNMRITVDGRLAPHVYAMDLALHLLATLGVDGTAGHVIEYAGPAIRAMSMVARVILCNLSIEMGARTVLIAPNETTFADVAGLAAVLRLAGFDWREPGRSMRVSMNADRL